jgi:hypothetical protein
MTQEMTSFVLRFVREVSEEQGARWRGLIQHVQSGAEANFATFADAVEFMQRRVLENTAQILEEGAPMEDKSPFSEMTRMWGDLAPQMAGMWSQTVEQVMGQSAAVRSQMDQAVATALKAWGLPSKGDQATVLSSLVKLGAQIEALASRVEALEAQLAAQQTTPDHPEPSEGRAEVD